MQKLIPFFICVSWSQAAVIWDSSFSLQGTPGTDVVNQTNTFVGQQIGIYSQRTDPSGLEVRLNFAGTNTRWSDGFLLSGNNGASPDGFTMDPGSGTLTLELDNGDAFSLTALPFTNEFDFGLGSFTITGQGPSGQIGPVSFDMSNNDLSPFSNVTSITLADTSASGDSIFITRVQLSDPVPIPEPNGVILTGIALVFLSTRRSLGHKRP